MSEEKSKKKIKLSKYDLLAVDDGCGGAVLYKKGKYYGRKMPWPDIQYALSLFGIKARQVMEHEVDFDS